MKITKTNKVNDNDNIIFLVNESSSLKALPYFSEQELKYIDDQFENKKESIAFNRLKNWYIVQIIKDEAVDYKRLEYCRKAGDKAGALLNDYKVKMAVVFDAAQKGAETLAFAEGFVLGNYQFLKYKKDRKEKEHKIGSLAIYSKDVKKPQIDQLEIVIDATLIARTLVNEPLSFLTATKLASEIRRFGNEAGAKVEVMTKKKIESLKMGGLLAVNKGSIDPPTFTIIEWKPEKTKNKKPIVLVGKGVVFDTGGVNIKPGNYMNTMKCDMAGAAIMSATVIAAAKARLPVHVIGLIPATDNRPDGNAYVPDDVIKMYDGTTVEIGNTDAEGRMILADALSYAKKYDPQIVIDAATLTGAASRAIGKYGIVAMEQGAEKEMAALKESGFSVYERIAEFPFWDEYGELIKSDIADIKNIGGPDAGMITAGKFLAHFTDYPFIHLDIAGPAHIDKKMGYITTGGTGVGVRLLFDYLKNYKS